MGCFQSSNPVRSKKVYDYDLIVVGGGAAGISCALTSATKFKKRVLLCNYVERNFEGNKWSLGGTSTNVGSIPKQIINLACEYIERVFESPKNGWNLPTNITHTHDWSAMMGNIQNYVRKRNFEWRVALNNAGVDWIDAYATFVDSHALSFDYRDDDSPHLILSAEKIVLAVGVKPAYDLDIPGCRPGDMVCSTTDEFFSRKKPPGRTLIIGGDYIAVECASLLVRLGYDVTMYLKTPSLDGLDKEFVWRINSLLVNEYGVKVIWEEEGPIKRVQLVDEHDEIGPLAVTFWHEPRRSFSQEIFDTVLVSIGRKLYAKQMKLSEAGVKLSEEDDKILVDWWDQTTVPHIYAIGDCATSRPENASMAKKSGIRLSYRLFKYTKKEDGKLWTERGTFYDVPFVLQTPIEYGTWGLSEEDADKKFGEDNVLVYETHYEPIEWALTRMDRPYANEDFNDVWGKLVCQNTTRGDKIVGFHYMGPLAAEITQTIAMASQFNIKKATFDNAFAVYPSIARMFFNIGEAKGDERVYNKTEVVPW